MFSEPPINYENLLYSVIATLIGDGEAKTMVVFDLKILAYRYSEYLQGIYKF
jgi:hypothetical protein